MSQRSPISDLIGHQQPADLEPRNAPSPGMSLNSAGAGDSGSGGMSSDKSLWSSAANGVGSLPGNLKRAMDRLSEEQKGFGAFSHAVTGFETGSAQYSVYGTWERYLSLISREAGEVSGKLEKAGNDHYKNEQAVREAFKEQLTKPEKA